MVAGDTDALLRTWCNDAAVGMSDRAAVEQALPFCGRLLGELESIAGCLLPFAFSPTCISTVRNAVTELIQVRVLLYTYASFFFSLEPWLQSLPMPSFHHGIAVLLGSW